MTLKETPLSGAFVIELELAEDERGYFARTYCRREFESRGLNPSMVQCSTSFNRRRGTLRGLHYQVAPHQESKLIRCTRGAIYDVIIDLRPESPTRFRWVATELSEENRRMVFVPEDFAHGFQSLRDNTEVFYQMSEFYSPEHGRGIRWNDPRLRVEWPYEPPIISSQDAGYPPLAYDL